MANECRDGSNDQPMNVKCENVLNVMFGLFYNHTMRFRPLKRTKNVTRTPLAVK